MAMGNLDHTDVDGNNNDDVWQEVTTPTASDTGYGTFVMNAGGQWTYTIDQLNTDVQALGDGDTITDTFTVRTEDGTEQVVTVTINGANDAPTGTVYKVISADSWIEAQQEAISLGGNLVTIDDADENAYVLNLIQNTPGMTASGAWIGYTDQQGEGTFGWIDGSSPTSYTNWADGEPNNFGNGADEDFVQMFAETITRVGTEISAGQWNDLPDTGLSDSEQDAEQVNPQFAVVEIPNPIAICGTPRRR